MKLRKSLASIFIIPIVLFFASCNNGNHQIPFPEKELGAAQPVSEPLVFTPELKLQWDTIKHEGIKPVLKKLDINTLPVVAYDSTGFIQFTQKAAEANFNYDALPAKSLHLDQLPAQSLEFKTTLLPPPAVTYIGKPIAQTGRPLDIYNMPSFQGIDGKLIVCFRSGKGDTSCK